MCRREQRIRWILIFYTATLLQKHGSYYTFYEQSTEMASCWGQSHKGKCSEVTLQQNNRIIQAWSWWARCSHSLSYFFIMRSVSCRGDSAVILNLSQLTHTHIIKNNKKPDYSHGRVSVCVFLSYDFLSSKHLFCRFSVIFSWKLFKLQGLTMQNSFSVTY